MILCELIRKKVDWKFYNIIICIKYQYYLFLTESMDSRFEYLKWTIWTHAPESVIYSVWRFSNVSHLPSEGKSCLMLCYNLWLSATNNLTLCSVMNMDTSIDFIIFQIKNFWGMKLLAFGEIHFSLFTSLATLFS